MNDSRILSQSRLNEIRATLEPLGGKMVTELFDHLAALAERVDTVGQYYEEFLIPEIQKGGWSTREEQKRDLASRGIRTPGDR